MAPLRGLGPCGEQLTAVRRGSARPRPSIADFIAGLSEGRVEAAWRFEQSVNGKDAHAYAETVPVATLRSRGIGAMDNLDSRKRKAVRQANRAVGAALSSLPTCSPGLNPIEQHPAELKHWLRRAAVRDPRCRVRRDHPHSR